MIGAHDDLAVQDHGTLDGVADGQDAGLGRVDDRAEVGHAEHAEVRDRERAALDVRLLQLALARPARQVPGLGRDLPHALRVGVAQHRHDQPVVEGDRDPHVGVRVVEQALVRPGAVELRVLHERAGDRAHHEVVEADLLADLRQAGVELAAQVHRLGHVDLVLQVEVRDGGLRLGHPAGDRAQHAGRLDQLSLRHRRGRGVPAGASTCAGSAPVGAALPLHRPASARRRP
jgi:hypothetical protein